MGDSVFGDLGGPGKQSPGVPPVPGWPFPGAGAHNPPATEPFGDDLGGPGKQQGGTSSPEPGSGDFPA